MKNIQNNFASCYKLEGRNDGTGKSERAESNEQAAGVFPYYYLLFTSTTILIRYTL
jgi:hypothetical protein